MIIKASPNDLPQLISLWQEAFGDSLEDTKVWFSTRHRDENMLVYKDQDQVVGMMSMLPIELVSQGQPYPARYVFAVATRKSHRGRGISTKLLEYSHDLMRREGSLAAVLVPAEADLFRFYEKRGYQPHFSIDEAMVEGGSLQAIHEGDSAFPCTAAEYAQIRNQAFSDSSLYLHWDVDALDFIKQSGLSNGDLMLKMSIGNRKAIAVCMVRDEYVRVTELVCEQDDVLRALALIHKHYQAQHYQVRTRHYGLGFGSSRPFGMIHWLGEPLEASGSPPYLSFAKD